MERWNPNETRGQRKSGGCACAGGKSVLSDGDGGWWMVVGGLKIEMDKERREAEALMN